MAVGNMRVSGRRGGLRARRGPRRADEPTSTTPSATAPSPNTQVAHVLLSSCLAGGFALARWRRQRELARAQRDDAGRIVLHLRQHPEKLQVSQAWAWRFRPM
jgi:hypothetical protein